MADTTVPQLTGLSFPAFVNVANGPQSITFTMSATDDASGIWGATVFFNGNLVAGGTSAGFGDLPDWADGTSSETLSVFANTPPGVYTITLIQLWDNSPNYNRRDYSGLELQALNISKQITVTSDTVLPQLTALTFPTNVDVTAGAQNITFNASATDNATGIQRVRVHFDKNLSTGGVGDDVIDIVGSPADSWADGASSFIEGIPPTAPTGDYNITNVEVIDGAGNVRTYTPAQLQALGIATTLHITGGQAGDTTPPELDGLTLPGAVKVAPTSAPIPVNATATDPGGIDDLTIWLDRNINLTTGPAGGFVLDGTNNSWSDGQSSETWSVATTAAAGIYQIDHVDLRDLPGNTATYTAAQLAARGIRTAFFVLDASFDVAASDVLVGTVTNDSLQGTGNNNVLVGLSGNDILSCGGGSDWMYGGVGDDTYNVSTTGDRVIEAASEGFDRVFASVSFTLTISQHIEFFATNDPFGTAAIDLFGNGLAQTIEGNDGANTLGGSGGNDSLSGGLGQDTADFASLRAQYDIRTLLGLSGGLYTTVTHVGGSAEDGADTLLSIERLSFSDGAFALVRAQQNHCANVDGGRYDDVVFQSVISGQIIFQNMNAGFATGFDAITNPVPGWTVIGTGDVSNDGRADVAIWNQASGFIYSVLPGASLSPSYGLLAGGITGTYSALGLTDINGDAAADVLVRESSTGSIFWRNTTDGIWAYVGINIGSEWNYQAAGDVNRDGFSDVVIRHTSGLVYIANMAGGVNSGYFDLGNLSGYQVRTVADVNADGYADVIVQRDTDGWTLWRDLSGIGPAWNMATNPVGTEWTVKDAADVDNDGCADLIFQHSATGETLYRGMDNGVGTGWQVVSTPLGTEWVVV